MKSSHSWVEADRAGLAQLIADRPKAFIVYELLSNALDEASSRVDLTLERLPGRPYVRLVVVDDNPQGFHDLSHAFRLFAPSTKKCNPEQRGRYNLGEKLVLALCREATITTTTGSVEFRSDGTRREHSRTRTEVGSRFEGLIRMTQEELDQALREVRRVILPPNVAVYFNGERLEVRTPIRTIETTLPTALADAEGILRATRRKTQVEVYDPAPGEPAMIYEMGIPVVATGDRYHVNVLQKVPLNSDRDNVTPAFLRAIRTAVVNQMAECLSQEEAAEGWVTQALGSPEIAPETVRAVIRSRFGDQVVTVDPGDPEATNRAVSHGYTVIPGRSLPKAAWINVRAANAAPSASTLFPTRAPYAEEPGAEPATVVPHEEWTASMRETVVLTERLARKLMGVEIQVRIVHTTNPFAACYGGRELHFNLRKLGHAFFQRVQTGDLTGFLDLLLDEFGHEYEMNHLSERYYRALRSLGAKMTVLALQEPGTFLPRAR